MSCGMPCWNCGSPIPADRHRLKETERVFCSDACRDGFGPPPVTPPLTADPSVPCTAAFDDDGEYCRSLSRFAVERSDRDPSFGVQEACEAHLADAVTGMADGNEDVHAIVRIRWDSKEG